MHTKKVSTFDYFGETFVVVIVLCFSGQWPIIFVLGSSLHDSHLDHNTIWNGFHYSSGINSSRYAQQNNCDLPKSVNPARLVLWAG